MPVPKLRPGTRATPQALRELEQLLRQLVDRPALTDARTESDMQGKTNARLLLFEALEPTWGERLQQRIDTDIRAQITAMLAEMARAELDV